MWLIRSVITLIGVVAVLWIGMINAGQQVDFTFFTKTFLGLSLNLLILAVFLAGMLFSFVIFILSEFQLRHTVGQKQKEISRLERELAALRNLPLEESQGGSEESTMGL